LRTGKGTDVWGSVMVHNSGSSRPRPWRLWQCTLPKWR